MATKRITEVVFITAQEIVGALQLLGYPISGSEKVEVKWRKPGGGDFDGLTFTTEYDSTVRRSEPPQAAPEKPADAASDAVVKEPAPARPSEGDMPF